MPGFQLILIRHCGDTQWIAPASGPLGCRRNILHGHRLNAGQKCPLVGIGNQRLIDKNTAAKRASPLLQGQGNQVAKAAFGHAVLIGKQSVIRAQRQLPGTLAGMTDDRGAEQARLIGGDITLEENPGMRPVTGAGNLQGHRHI